MDAHLFPELIQFSWTVTALIFGAQGWLFLQEFKGNRVFRFKHIALSLAFIANVVAAICLFILLDLVLNESLKQSKNFVAENIKTTRTCHTYALLVTFIATTVAAFLWTVTKNQKETKKDVK